MANTHLRFNGRRRLVGLVASVLILIFAALPASQASATVTYRAWPVTSLSGVIWPTQNFLGGTSNMRFWHQNGYCTNQSGSFCYRWRSGQGSSSFVVYGPYETLPYGYYQACWHVADLTPGQGPQLWMQTTADQGRRYLGGTAPVIAAGYNYYCYWFGSGYAMGNVEFRAIMGNHASNSQVEIAYPLEIWRYN